MHLSVKERITYNPQQTLEKLGSTWDTFLELVHYTSLQEVSLERGEIHLSVPIPFSPLPFLLTTIFAFVNYFLFLCLCVILISAIKIHVLEILQLICGNQSTVKLAWSSLALCIQ